MEKYRVCTLASGSSGNSIYIESAEGAILIDAGISGKAITENLNKISGKSKLLQGIILTHSHSDHSKSAGIISRKYNIPVYTTQATYQQCVKFLGQNVAYNFFRPGEQLELAGFKIETIPTPHDAAESVALIFEKDNIRCGILTDLGHVFYKLQKEISSLNAVILESNYDPDMLKHGPYPQHLKRRIASKAGHISNEEAAYLLLHNSGQQLQTVLLAHLSNKNNTPEKALQCHINILKKSDKKFKLLVAPRSKPSEIISLK